MATYLLTVRETHQVDSGIRLSPGIRPSETSDRPAIGEMTQGSRLELRCPDGSVHLTHLVTYGISAWKGEDGALYMNDDPADPEIRLTIAETGDAGGPPPGTEVWLLESA